MQEEIKEIRADVKEIRDAIVGTIDSKGVVPRLDRLEERDANRQKREYGLWSTLVAGLLKMTVLKG